MVERCVRIAKVTSSNLVISTNQNLKRTPFVRTVLGFFFFLLQTYSYQILFRHYFGVIQRKTDNIQIPTENNNALKLKIAARRIRADRQAVQRRPSIPVRFEFRLVTSVSYGGCLNGEAQPSRSFIQAPTITPKSYIWSILFALYLKICYINYTTHFSTFGRERIL